MAKQPEVCETIWPNPSAWGRCRKAIGLLVDTHAYTRDLGCSVWEFGVSAAKLHEYGMEEVDLRWMVRAGLAEHEHGTTFPSATQCPSVRHSDVSFDAQSLFVLTSTGYARFRHACFDSCWSAVSTEILVRQQQPPPGACRIGESTGNESLQQARRPEAETPFWDRDRGELRVGRIVVKRFRLPARNQETVLAVFEEEGWPPRIDDPLPPRAAADPKKRLHDTINSLNRHQINPLIRFHGDGNGEGVRWELNLKSVSKT